VNGLVILLIAWAVVYVPLTGYLYGRQRRWLGMLGWDIFVLGLLLAFGGAGDAFAWAGLLWSAIAAAGLLLIVMDVFELRRRRER